VLKRSVGLSVGLLILSAGLVSATHYKVGRPKDPVSSYRAWKKVNDKPIYMEPFVAGSCIGPPWWDGAKDNPHVPKYFTVYVNKIGEKAMMGKSAASFPVGSMVVKEKFNKNDLKRPELLTVMTKRAKGFDPQNGDWEYMVYNGSLSTKSDSNKKACQSCHSSQKDDDFVYRNYVEDYIRTQPKSLDWFKAGRIRAGG